MNKLILFLSLALLLPACTTIPVNSHLFKAKYNALMKKTRTEAAVIDIKQFKKLQNMASTNRERMQAELALAYAYYKDSQFDTCVTQIEDFAHRYPSYPHLDYVLYLRALATKASGKQQFIKAVSHISKDAHYPEKLRLAYTYFVDLITRYPKSRYSTQALSLMKNIRTNLAAYEMFIARYEQVDGHYKKVVRRTEYVLEFYKGTPVVNEAYTLQAKAYRALGKIKKADEVEIRQKRAERSSNGN